MCKVNNVANKGHLQFFDDLSCGRFVPSHMYTGPSKRASQLGVEFLHRRVGSLIGDSGLVF